MFIGKDIDEQSIIINGFKKQEVGLHLADYDLILGELNVWLSYDGAGWYTFIYMPTINMGFSPKTWEDMNNAISKMQEIVKMAAA